MLSVLEFFILASCCDVTWHRDEHMAIRPIADLVGALEQMGVEVDCPTGCPPITIKGGTKGLPGGKVTMRGSKSSQYFSALMLSGAFAAQPTEIQIEGTLVSLPYVIMTMKMVKALTGGVIVHDSNKNSITVHTLAADSAADTEMVCLMWHDYHQCYRMTTHVSPHLLSCTLVHSFLHCSFLHCSFLHALCLALSVAVIRH